LVAVIPPNWTVLNGDLVVVGDRVELYTGGHGTIARSDPDTHQPMVLLDGRSAPEMVYPLHIAQRVRQNRKGSSSNTGGGEQSIDTKRF